jgi:very-short-patch-repair endonuclease
MCAAPTEAERKLWWHLRHRIRAPGAHFRRQVRIGRYIVDFACHAVRMIIEVDGSQHVRSAADEERRKVLEANGYRVLRYWNNDVLSNIDSVLEDVLSAITPTPTPNPSPTQVGPARLAHYMHAQPGQARVAWGEEHTESAATVRRAKRSAL